MGRKRIIDQQAILDAAERAVGRDGATNLTIDAVAKEASVNKASVLYDHKSKQTLVEAVVDRAFERDAAFHAGIEKQIDARRNRAIRVRILAAAEPPPQEFKAVALNLSAALALDVELRSKMQESQARTIARIEKTSPLCHSRPTCLGWLCAQSARLYVKTVLIPGTRKRIRLEENAAATAIKLTAGEMHMLEPLASAVQGIAV